MAKTSKAIDVVVPDLGIDEDVDVVEVLVTAGDRVGIEDGLVTLESDKASMDVPSPAAGVVLELKVKPGDKVRTGSVILLLEATDVSEPKGEASEAADEPAKPTKTDVADESQRKPSRSPETAGVDLPGKRLVVIGSGPGGYTAAFRAADLGLDVTLIERHQALGGVCLNVGCIPSKALLHVAEVIREAEAMSHHGVSFGAPEIDREKLLDWKQEVVTKLTNGISTMAKQRKVTQVQGTATFAAPNELEVTSADGTQSIPFDQAIIAVGSRVVEVPGLGFDDPRVMDSTSALELADIPKRLLVVGGGIIGLEMAMVYGALGSKLTVVELLDGLIPGCDRDLVRPLQRRLEKDLGVEVHLETKVVGIETRGDGLVARLEGPKAPETAEFDRVLVAVGRRSNGDRVGAEAAGVVVDERGFIAVDREQRTNVPHIFAIGDVVGQPMLAHKASHEGKVAAENAAGAKSAFDARVIPSVAYTDPEIAWVGLTETQAKADGTRYEKGMFPWVASGRSLAMGNSAGLTKILFDPESNKILGAGITGPGAGELIAELTLAIEMDVEAGDLALTIHPHPTLSETVAFTAEVYEGTITDLYLPRKKS